MRQRFHAEGKAKITTCAVLLDFADLRPRCIGQLRFFERFALVRAQNTGLGGRVCPKSEFSTGKYSKTVGFADLSGQGLSSLWEKKGAELWGSKIWSRGSSGAKASP